MIFPDYLNRPHGADSRPTSLYLQESILGVKERHKHLHVNHEALFTRVRLHAAQCMAQILQPPASHEDI